MEKKYLEIYGSTQLLGAFENVRDFEESENEIKFVSDEGEFDIKKDERGVWRTRVFGQPVAFQSYRLVGRRTMLKKVDADRLGHSKEYKKEYEDREEESRFNREARYEQLVREETHNYMVESGNGFRAIDKRYLTPIVNELKKHYNKVTIEYTAPFYYIEYEGVKR